MRPRFVLLALVFPSFGFAQTTLTETSLTPGSTPITSLGLDTDATPTNPYVSVNVPLSFEQIDPNKWQIIGITLGTTTTNGETGSVSYNGYALSLIGDQLSGLESVIFNFEPEDPSGTVLATNQTALFSTISIAPLNSQTFQTNSSLLNVAGGAALNPSVFSAFYGTGTTSLTTTVNFATIESLNGYIPAATTGLIYCQATNITETLNFTLQAVPELPTGPLFLGASISALLLRRPDRR